LTRRGNLSPVAELSLDKGHSHIILHHADPSICVYPIRSRPMFATTYSTEKRDTASEKQIPGQWRDEATSKSNTPAADDAHARKKRKVDAAEPSSTTSSTTDKTASVIVGTPRTATQVPDARPPSTGRLTRSPQATKATQVQSGKAGPPGSTVKPIQVQGAATTRQAGQQSVRPPQSAQPTPRPHAQPPRPAAQASTSADDVVIAEVDAEPSPKRASAPPKAAPTTTEQAKKSVKRPPPLTNVPVSGTGNGSTQPSAKSTVEVEAPPTGLPSGLANVSPVVSGFPMQSADKATLESVSSAGVWTSI
jgi:hypothetical protein